MCDQQRLRSACTYAQSDQNLCWLLEYSMRMKLLTEHHLRVISLKGGSTGSSESTLVKLSKCHIVGNHMSWLNYIIYFENGIFQIELPSMAVDLTDGNLWMSLATIIFNPLFWNIVSYLTISR